MKCPHCTTAFYYDNYIIEEELSIDETPFDADELYEINYGRCPECNGLIIIFELYRMVFSDGEEIRESIETETIYPKFPNIEPLPEEIPGEYSSVFIEASQVLQLSEKASAALSRRLLQTLLRDKYGIKKRNLDSEIEEFTSKPETPEDLAGELDAIRVIGNFAAHPIKSEASGEITEVEPDEAEHSLETLRNLLDYTFVRPARKEERKNKLNAKLKAAGKQPLKKKK